MATVKLVFEDGEVDKAAPREARAWLRNHGLTVKNAKKDKLDDNQIWTFEGVKTPVEKPKPVKEEAAEDGKKAKKAAAAPAKGKASDAAPKGKASKSKDWEEDEDDDDDDDDD